MKLIVHADDFGMTKSINSAVIELCKEGTMTSTSIMVNMPFFEEALLLMDLPMSIGLHSTFTQGKPILNPEEISSITDDSGFFLDYNLLQKRIKENKVLFNDVYKELEAQFLRLKTLIGDDLTFIDSHHGLHSKFKVFQRAFLKLGNDYKIRSIRTKRPYFILKKGHKIEMVEPKLTTIGKVGFKRYISALYYRNLIKAYDSVYNTPDGMILGDGKGIVDLLKLLVSMEDHCLPKGTFYVVSHPSKDIMGLESSNLKESRVEEFEFLRSIAFKEFSKKVEMTDFSKI